MPERSWSIVLNDLGDHLFVRFVKERGVVVDYAVRYEAMVDGALLQAVLCDGSHGRGHCHEVDWNGTKLTRVWAADGADLGEAMTGAIDDLTTNWERYRDAFLRRRP